MELDNASESVVSKYPSILRTAHSSFKSLLSKALVHDVLRPSLDNLVSLSSVVLNAFNESCVARLSKMGDKMLGNEAPGDPWDEFSVELLSLAWTSVSVLYENIVLSPNQKKVFTAISVDRFVLPLLQAHKLLSSLEPPSNIFYEKPISLSTTLPSTVSDTCKSLRAHIISIIDHGLLHHEHLSDLSVLSSNSTLGFF
ncbi:hypothetical protein BC829DRAFT_186577 [Chytridium lagenaria]|nr:hypothetical protein BC829DRAFT_186577 [Chytridium lagenaria]